MGNRGAATNGAGAIRYVAVGNSLNQSRLKAAGAEAVLEAVISNYDDDNAKTALPWIRAAAALPPAQGVCPSCTALYMYHLLPLPSTRLPPHM